MKIDAENMRERWSYSQPQFTELIYALCAYVCVFKGAYWISSNSSFIQYCDSNIELFSFASHIVIALPTIATAKVVALTRSQRYVYFYVC